MERDEVTKRIDEILEPYLGRVDYGNLRKAKKWPSFGIGHINYGIGFDTNFLSTDCISLQLFGDNTISINYGEYHYSIDNALKRLEKWMIIIPNLRFKKTIKRVKFEIEKRYVLSFEELLEKECKELFKKETDFYAEDELKKLRAYFSQLK